MVVIEVENIVLRKVRWVGKVLLGDRNYEGTMVRGMSCLEAFNDDNEKSSNHDFKRQCV